MPFRILTPFVSTILRWLVLGSLSLFCSHTFSVPLGMAVEEIERPFTPAEVQDYLERISQLEHVDVQDVGQSYDGRPIPLIKIAHNDQAEFKIFYHAQQHGNETSGKDALMFLMEEYATYPERLPDNLALYLMPLVNPDGAHENERENHHHADLNRDHILLKQKETQLLHKLIRDIQPHIVVDGHEFKRDTYDFVEQGWKEWPLVMVDVASHPLYDSGLYDLGEQWLDKLDQRLNQNGFNHDRYAIVYNPPYGEYRFSTMDADDARNSAGVFYGALSFIVEAGVFKQLLDDPYEDLERRVSAYLDIYRSFIEAEDQYDVIMAAVEKARKRAAPTFLPTNYFWGSEPGTVKTMNVINIKTDKVETVTVPNYMPKRVVKKRVFAPNAYVIDAKQADAYAELLDKHGIPYKRLAKTESMLVEPCTLQTVQEEYDELYERYGGRQLVTCEKKSRMKLAKGSLVVTLNGSHAHQAAIILEPQNLYGLYQYESYRETLLKDKRIPVYRVFDY